MKHMAEKEMVWMRKIAVLVLACICVLGFTGCSGSAGSGVGVKPYEELTAADITSATVHLIPPDKTIQIEDLEELVKLLNDVVTYNEDNSYTEYAGQGVTFALTLADGRQTRVMAYNPFLVIDGVGYKTEYEPCEALNAYANNLLNSENNVVILEKPPALEVVSDETAVGALLGTYSWLRTNEDGTITAIEACGAHPLEYIDSMIPLETTEKTAVLHFLEEPDSIIRVRCWSVEQETAVSADGESVTVNGDTIELKPGEYIYEVVAQWDEESGYGGTAYYSFYIKTI